MGRPVASRVNDAQDARLVTARRKLSQAPDVCDCTIRPGTVPDRWPRPPSHPVSAWRVCTPEISHTASRCSTPRRCVQRRGRQQSLEPLGDAKLRLRCANLEREVASLHSELAKAQLSISATSARLEESKRLSLQAHDCRVEEAAQAAAREAELKRQVYQLEVSLSSSRVSSEALAQMANDVEEELGAEIEELKHRVRESAARAERCRLRSADLSVKVAVLESELRETERALDDERSAARRHEKELCDRAARAEAALKEFQDARSELQNNLRAATEREASAWCALSSMQRQLDKGVARAVTISFAVPSGRSRGYLQTETVAQAVRRGISAVNVGAPPGSDRVQEMVARPLEPLTVVVEAGGCTFEGLLWT
mmetsp:Transcript_76797/g.205163  ORF Transcript_76797/g.205163 Transcript_76797/m.205163 type:complete len:370 (-) Transcript_76797:15-1124(-)